MATYLQGSNKYIPQIQPYQPDLNFYKSVLDTKTAQYEAGYDRVNSIYGTLLNSPLTRQDTSTMRNDFFSKANNEIQRLAGVDLSIEDNQTAAFQVFKPLTTNKLFAKDVNFTKDLYNEYDRSEFFRNCINEKECGGKFWQGGVDYLQYKAQDFAQADENTAMSMESPKYVPFVNTVQEAVDFAISSKLEMQTITSDGRYIYTTTNGTPMEAPLHSYFIAKYGNDQKAADMYNVSAYLQRKAYGQEKAAQFGSTAAAEADYIQQVLSAADKANREYKRQAEQTKETVNAKKGVVEDYIRTKGVDPEMDKDLIEYYRRLNDDTQAADATDSFYKESLDISSPTSLEGISQTALAARADAILARNLLDSDMATAARSYATMTQKQKVEADPIYLENLDFSHQMSLESYKNQNAMQKSQWEYANDLEKMLWKSRLETDVPVGKVEKALGLLNDAFIGIKDKLSSSKSTDKTASGNTVDAYDDADETKKKSPEQLKYEADLRSNALKQKEQRENELEFQIHQLRGHSSGQVWQAMGKDKLSALGINEQSDLLFLDSQERQLAVAADLFKAYQQGSALSEKEKVIAGAYSMGWGTDVQGYAEAGYNKFGPLKNAYSDAKPAEATQATAQATAAPQTGGGQGPIAIPQAGTPSDSSAVATTNIPQAAPTDTTATANTTTPVDSTLVAQAAPQQTASQDSVAYKTSYQALPDNEALTKAGITNIEDLKRLQEFAKKPYTEQIADPNFGTLSKSLNILQNEAKGEVMLDAAEAYTKIFGGPENFTQEFENLLRQDIRSYLSGTKTEENSIFGVITPYAINDLSEQETTAGKINPTSTEEFKNIQMPASGESLLQTLFDKGLAGVANKIESSNAITAGFDKENSGVTKFKNIAVKTILGKYQDKIRGGSANEKKSALASLKKMFPKFKVSDDGNISGTVPDANANLPIEDYYDNALNEFNNDPLFRDDTDKAKIVDATAHVNNEMQAREARLKVDQYNIGQVANKMLTNEGLMGTGTDLTSFMDKYLFKNMGVLNSPNTPANNSPLKAVRTREDFMKDIYSNEKIWTAADIIADAAISVTNYYDETGRQVASATAKAAGVPTPVYKDTYDNFIKQNPLNPQISKVLANKANQLLGRDPEAWFENIGFSGDKNETAAIVNALNQNGINGKEVLKEAIMETWSREGRTSEWQLYDTYVRAKGGQVPRLEFEEIPVIGYDKFTKEYGIAAADLNANLQTYAIKNQIGDAYSGQGGLVALPYGINFNEGVDLATGTGNQDLVGLFSNLNSVLASDPIRKKAFNQRAYILDMSYNDVVKEVDISKEPIEDWDWDNTGGNIIENIFSGTLESKHKKAYANTYNLMAQMTQDLKAQANLNQFQKLDILEGDIKTYPVAVGTKDMTAYQITLNGEYAKSKGYQEHNKDKVFTVLIPTYKAENTLYRRAASNSWVDLALWANGKAVIDVPNSGTVTITQDDKDNYVMNGQMYLPDSLSGNISLQQLSPQVASKGTIPGWLFADQIMQQLFGNYMDLSQINLNKKANGDLIKEPSALLN